MNNTILYSLMVKMPKAQTEIIVQNYSEEFLMLIIEWT